MPNVYIEGNTFESKEEIKAITRSDERVFRWDTGSKSWCAEVDDNEIDGLAEEVSANCPGCRLRVEIGTES